MRKQYHDANRNAITLLVLDENVDGNDYMGIIKYDDKGTICYGVDDNGVFIPCDSLNDAREYVKSFTEGE